MQTECTDTGPLKGFLNLNSHEIVVNIQDKYYHMPSDGSAWKVEYSFKTTGPVGVIMRAVHVRNIGNPNLGLDCVVSRETLRAIMEIEKYLLGLYGLQELVLEMGKGAFKKKLLRNSAQNCRNRFKEMQEHMDNNVLPALHAQYYMEIKKYLFRTDVWSPGPRIRKENHDTVACRGLIQLG